MNNGNKVVEVLGLTKKYGSLAAVDNVSFDVTDGEIFGFLGPNGAGKTTLVRMLTTLVEPTSGRARVAGFDVARDPGAVRRHIGVIPQAMTSDLDLTGHENLDIYARFYGIPGNERKERIAGLLEMLGLTNRADELVATYSGGMRRRLEIARVLIHRPKVLFLDEPSIGLDPQSRRTVWEFLGNIRAENAMSIFLTTHYMEEAEALCSRVAIIDSGKIVALGAPEELKRQIPGNDLLAVTLDSMTDNIGAALKKLPFVHKLYVEENNLRVYVDRGAENLPIMMQTITTAGGRINSVSIHEQSLEDVFIHYTGKSIREEEGKKVNLLLGAGVPQRWGR